VALVFKNCTNQGKHSTLVLSLHHWILIESQPEHKIAKKVLVGKLAFFPSNASLTKKKKFLSSTPDQQSPSKIPTREKKRKREKGE